MSKNNFKGITLVTGPIWGIHSLTLIISGLPDNTRYDSHIITLVSYYAFSINNDLEMTEAVKRIELCLNDVDKGMRIKQQTETRQRKDRAPLYSFKIQTTATFTVNLLSRTIKPIKPSQTARNIGHVLLSTVPCF